MYPESKQVKDIIESATDIVIIQADNPDADSLGSALALEAILIEIGKKPTLYCAVDIPSYLRYMNGWDRVENQLPKYFDASIIVDASTKSLLEKLYANGEHNNVSSKPCIVLDHHATVENVIDFAQLTINDESRASTGELIYIISKDNDYKIPLDAMEFILFSILGDTQGLSNQLASAQTYRIVAEMIDAGVNRPKLEEIRRAYSKMPKIIYKYKGDLINRTKFLSDDQIAYTVITQPEISKYSPLYNPAPLIQNDMLQTDKVKIAFVFKTYNDGKVTAAIRSNIGTPIAGKIAEYMGGGGHDFASGFKDNSNRDSDIIIKDCLKKAQELIES